MEHDIKLLQPAHFYPLYILKRSHLELLLYALAVTMDTFMDIRYKQPLHAKTIRWDG